MNKKIRHAVRTYLIENDKVVAIEYQDHDVGYFDIPGGKIEEGETPEETSIREFKEETGMTYTAFLRHLRMSKAATMLLNSNNSVAYISELMGFLNTETFIRTFQKEFHETPTQYRKHYKN